MRGIGETRTVPSLLSWRRSHHPDRAAIEVHGAEPLTFARWEDDSARLANALRRKGIAPGAIVGLVFSGRDWASFAIAYVGVQKAGAVAVPVHDELPPARVERLLSSARAQLTITGRDDVDKLVASEEPTDRDDSRPDCLAQILFTSGTSGEPKGVAATHANLTTNAPSHPRRMALAHSERFLHAFPIGTNAGQTMLLNSLTAKPWALVLPQFTPRRMAKLLPHVGTAFMVPSMAIELLDSGALQGVDLTGLHLVGCTAAALPPPIALRLAETFPNAAIVNYYTSTEAAPAQASMVFDPHRPDAVGKAPSGTIRITDETGTPVPDGVTGHVWLRSPHPRRYLGEEAFRDGWVRMGDIGRLQDGFLYLSDRDGDIVKSGAHKVSTLEIEAALYEHPAVIDAAVIGLPHPVLGAQLAAVVVARDPIGLPDLRAFLAPRLADYQLPSRLALADRLPRNDAGKVLKRQLFQYFLTGGDDT
ncbi:class I adenylate-forming enzyme family protein [Allorhizocola rhizosphaerae]|uniref:class I adenylate-forming enzyme family protein n=1 Tax=Allorhizocola rhizosphaerae TaxID=1872709 RepID=UPI000E3BBEAD|nr:AMP-binding protein [Allorhizocola rhizosphaerae]